MHDTDEVYDFDKRIISEFLESDKSVGFFRCQNLYSNGYRSEQRSLSTFDDLPLKAFVFKKDLVNENDHLNYLWLVGVSQHPKDANKEFLVPLAMGYHFTQMRSTTGQIQKFCFYSSLYASKNDIGSFTKELLEKISSLILHQKILREEAIFSYLSSLQHFSAVHNHDSDFYFDDRFKASERLESIITRVINNRHQPKMGDILLFNGLSYFFYLTASNLNKLLINNPNQIELTLKIYEYKYQKPYSKLHESILTHSDIKYNFDVQNDSHGFLVELISRDSRFPDIMKLNMETC